jgi:hypothetical protein
MSSLFGGAPGSGTGTTAPRTIVPGVSGAQIALD